MITGVGGGADKAVQICLGIYIYSRKTEPSSARIAVTELKHATVAIGTLVFIGHGHLTGGNILAVSAIP